MKLKPWQDHRWKAIPFSSTERYDALNVVCNKTITCSVVPKKYFNIDTGKFDFDRIETIDSSSIGELYSDMPSCYYYQKATDSRKTSRNDTAWFKPKDNDFDEECRRDEELRKNQERIQTKNSRKISKQKKKDVKKVKEVKKVEEIRHQQSNYVVDLKEEEEQRKLQEKNRINFIMDINNKISTIYRCETTTDYQKLKEIIQLVEEAPPYMKDEYSKYKFGLYQSLNVLHVAQRKEVQNMDKKINEINNNNNLSYVDKIKKKIILVSNVHPDLREMYEPFKQFLFKELINQNLKNRDNKVLNKPVM